MTESDPVPATRTSPDHGALALLAAGAAAFGVCCGLPLLASFGVAGVVAGLGVGSWVAVVVAVVVAVIGVLRWRSQGTVCEPRHAPAETEPVLPATIGVTTFETRAGR